MLGTSAPALAASTDILANGAANITSRSAVFGGAGGGCDTGSWWTNAHDHDEATATNQCDVTGVNSTYTVTFTTGPVAARYLRFKAAIAGTTTFTNFLVLVNIGNTCVWSTRTGQGCTTDDGGGWGPGTNDSGVVDLGSMISTSSPLTASVSIFTVGAGGTVLFPIYAFELWDADPAIQGSYPAPAFNAVYLCKAEAVDCDITTSAAESGWSPQFPEVQIGMELADTGADGPCDVRLSELDGAGYVDLGPLEYGTPVTAIVTDLSNGQLHAGAYILRCSMPDDPTLSTAWPFTLRYNGTTDGASNVSSVTVVPPGATYNPVRDIGDGTPLAAVFDAWENLLNAYRVRAPFVFFQPASDFITNTKVNIDAAKMTPAPGRYGPTTCPGYTMTLPSPPVIHYTTPYGASASSNPWPTGQPMPSFTVLKCADFETIVGGWSWWHQARGLLDVGLYVGYGLFWLKRMQPRPSLNG